jgi:hypothetical protein
MRTNTAKAKMAEGKVVFGAIISRHAPDLVELFGAIGSSGSGLLSPHVRIQLAVRATTRCTPT